MEKEIAKKETQQTEIAKKLNDKVFSVISADTLAGFEKAYLIADATSELKKLLVTEYMKPIMELQGNRLGFKTDKDDKGGYSEAQVKNCLIEAVLMGVQPFGNQFNIIAGNCYITKEGFGYLLSRYPGLSYEITPNLPRIKDASAAIVMDIEWSIGGVKRKKQIDIPVKVNAYMGTDAVIGKATRKARCWLYNTITGSEITDGDATDTDAVVIKSTLNGEQTLVTLEDLQLLFDMKKGVMNQEEIENANRIINNREENSFGKLHKTLQAK